MTKKRTLLDFVKEIRSSSEKDQYELHIIDRLNEKGFRAIKGSDIIGITGFDQIVLRDETVIPIHRIVRIVKGEKVLIERKQDRRGRKR